MSFFKFSLNNLVRNKRTYLAHFLSSSFAVFVFFIYALLQFHPDLQGQLVASNDTIRHLGKMGIQVAQVVIFLFSFFFLLYSVSAFLKTRKREIGTMLLLGMSKKQLNTLLFFENMMIGLTSLLTGLLFGLVFAKIILLLMARLLVLENGLVFYMPWEAMGVTVVTFLLMFAGLAALSSVLLKKDQIINLISAEDKPKIEPKASPLRAFLAIVLIGAGYAAVFQFAVNQMFFLPLLAAGVGLVILGTYFLFTQLSVYILKIIKKTDVLYLRKTNILFFSELVYRLKDNAIMFFLISIITASAFTGIGTSLSIGDPGLEKMQNPYAFTYTAYQSKESLRDDANISYIENELTNARFDYDMVHVELEGFSNGRGAAKLSEYNQLLKALGYNQETLGADEVILAPTSYTDRNKWRLEGYRPQAIDLVTNSDEIIMNVKKLDSTLAFAKIGGEIVVLNDDVYNDMFGDSTKEKNLYTQFVIDDWVSTYEIAGELVKVVNTEERIEESSGQLASLVLDWYSARQTNGILLMISGMVGVVFFVYAASFIYFRLYSDLERDQKQYRVIRKVGLTSKELRRIMSQQLLLMFFFPMGIALIHSTVGFIALQQLIEFPVWKHVLWIYLFFFCLQVLYFFTMRWRYLKQLEQKI